ncbi:hypothetical protein [Micromonospora sp. NPDC126480]|uniref:hypothetical protein n=1 Tax=Micromonospora sp. NPDC126480 TaxID=3155312 RepID=UPI003327818B
MTLPTLPGCGQPATVRIEIFSPASGPSGGSLDGSLYACEQHAADMVTALQAAGFNAYRVSGGDRVKRCGEGLDFTGPAPQPLTAPEVQHPTWCIRGKLCTDEGIHHSRPLTVVSGDALDLVRIWSERAWTVDRVSFVLETTVEGAVGYTYLTTEQARVLRHLLGRLLDQSKGSSRRREEGHSGGAR